MKITSIKATLIALFISASCKAQITNYIVTNALDTIRVDKITVTDSKIKTMKSGKKEKYEVDQIISFYDLGENSHFERVKNPKIDKLSAKQTDRYDYRELERQHLDDYEKTLTNKFFKRLTTGKVKLFTNGSIRHFVTSSPSASYAISTTSSNNKSYYISIYDSKPELIKDNEYLELNEELYELLKVYLYGNDEISKRLDKLFLSKPVAKEQQVVDWSMRTTSGQG